MLIVRCSSLDRALSCAGSLVDADAPFTPHNPEAVEGTAAHALARQLVLGQTPDVDAVAARYGVEHDTLDDLLRRARDIWAEVAHWFDGEKFADSLPMQYPLDVGVHLAGTPDLVDVLRKGERVAKIVVLDWKFGWSPSEHTNQLRGYAYLAREQFAMPTEGHITAIEAWVRAGELRIHQFKPDDLYALRTDVLAQVDRKGEQYGPGAVACRYCPRQNECSARADWVRSGVAALQVLDDSAPVTPERVGALYDVSKQVRSALAHYDRVLDTLLDDGPVPLPDGRRLVLDEQDQDSIRPSKAFAYLRQDMRLTPEEADRVLSVSKVGLASVLKDRAPARKGAAFMRSAMSDLRERGAVDKKTRRTKKVLPPPEESKQ